MKTTMIMVMSADGFTTLHDQSGSNWASKEDMNHFMMLTKEAGVVIMGRKTYELLKQPLKGRLVIVLTKEPQKCTSIKDEVEFTNQSPQVILDDLAQRGYDKVALAGGPAVNALFLQKHLVDELSITIEPKLFGHGKRLFDDLHLELPLKLTDYKLLNDHTINLTYSLS